MKRNAAGIALTAATLLLGAGPAGAAGTPAGHGLAAEIVKCTGGVSGDAIRSGGLAVWMDGSQWLVTSFTSDTSSWSKPIGAGRAHGDSVTCQAPDGAVVTMVELRRA